jgi:hypothetical protein
MLIPLRGIALAVVLPVLAAGCAGKGSDDDAPATPAKPATAAPAPKPLASAPSGTTTAQQPNHPLIERDPGFVKSVKPKPPTIDNLRCFACHANYDDEPLVLFHAGGGVACEKCHGESKKHTNDEDNVIAPDIMYAREKIAAACWECHPEVKPPKGFQPVVAEDAKKVCTDCHFRHRLPQRQRVWDKATGKLLSEPPENPMTTPR